jgi:hypothetical protein
MALQTTVCTTKEPQALATVDKNTGVAHPAGVCQGTYIRHEGGEGGSVTLKGKVYTCFEVCQRCGNIIGIS